MSVPCMIEGVPGGICGVPAHTIPVITANRHASKTPVQRLQFLRAGRFAWKG